MLKLLHIPILASVIALCSSLKTFLVCCFATCLLCIKTHSAKMPVRLTADIRGNQPHLARVIDRLNEMHAVLDGCARELMQRNRQTTCGLAALVDAAYLFAQEARPSGVDGGS